MTVNLRRRFPDSTAAADALREVARSLREGNEIPTAYRGILAGEAESLAGKIERLLREESEYL